ncbi:MAG: cytochrome b/b6 domain-containing protein [Deltaproteobacteria bacterium]|nr:cytochrome b/b6 domain-containing protein [Deltaproteobacteria bacterium]
MEPNNERVRVIVDVWDWPIRVLHWVNMSLIFTLALLVLGNLGMEYLGVGEDTRDQVAKLHATVGYVFIGTFSLRLLWGFVGNKYASWRDIIPCKKEQREAIAHNIKWYLSGFRGKAAKVVGHDPLASIFYMALFIVLLSQAATGLLLSGTEFKMFPGTLFVGSLSESASETIAKSLKEVHELGFWFIVFFICAHLGGLVVHEVKEKTGLFSSMIHGKKYLPRE